MKRSLHSLQEEPNVGRPKEFDPDLALEKAMEVFWRQGFDGTSVQDLVDHMGINRGSLYDTFGDKKSLFMKVLDRYAEQQETCGLVQALEQPGPAFKVLADTLEGMIDCKDRKGCLMTNVAVEKAQHCGDTAARVAAGIARSEEAFQRLLARGVAEGDLRADLQPRAGARYLVTLVQGLVVMAKANAPQAHLRDAVKVALDHLR